MSAAACSRWLSVGVTMTVALQMPDFASSSTDGKDGHFAADLRQEAAGTARVRLGQRDQFTGLCIAGQFVYVKGVDGAHAAEAGHGNW